MSHPPGRSRLFGAIVVAILLLVVTLVVAGRPVSVRADDGGVLLAVPYRGQLDGSLYAGSNCGPAALAMVLAAYDRDVAVADVRATVNDLQRTWGNPDAGAAIENLAVIAQQHGLEPLDLSAGDRLRRWTLDDVRGHLDAGHPVVPQVWYRGLPGREHRAYNGDHYIVLVGYQGDEFIYHDPVELDGIGPAARISAAQLERAWQESDLPFAALAFAGPPERRTLPPPAPTATPPPTATSPPTVTPSPTVTSSPTTTASPSPTATASPTATPPPAVAGTTEAAAPPAPPPMSPPAPPVAPALPTPGGPAVPLAMLLLAVHLAVMAGRWPPARRAAWATVSRPALRVMGALLSLTVTR